jgi:SAM-dependent methyltransferase
MGSAGVQGRLWGGAARDWADNQEPVMTPCYDAVFDAMGLEADMHLLDVGCGAGLAMQLAEKRGARPTGLDAAAGMLAVAWERLPRSDVRHGELEELPFDDDVFDAAVAFDALAYADDPAAAFRELRRVTRAGGPIAVLDWAEPDRCGSSAVLEALAGQLPPSQQGARGPFSLSRPGILAELAVAAGLSAGPEVELAVTFSYRNLDTALRAYLSTGRAQRAIAYVGRQAAVEAIATALAPSGQPDGGYRTANVFRYVIARG